MANKKIIIALGNPGKEYENTYHNAGTLLMNYELKEKYEAIEFKKYRNLFEYVEIDGTAYIKPLTFMNDSGKAVLAAIKKFRTSSLVARSSIPDLVVYHDDSDITIGAFKISVARNSAGHKGVQSIIDTLTTNNFTRVRIGIRPTNETKRKKASEFALKTISPSDRKILDRV